MSDERIFTIDPPGSRDLDDAISIRKIGANYIIGVHIADVASVVSRSSAVDVEARRRAVTFYPLDRKPHPMLPEPLSHSQCSLLPGQKRLALSVFFTLDANGKQVGSQRQ
jgi:exoribonuclease R